MSSEYRKNRHFYCNSMYMFLKNIVFHKMALKISGLLWIACFPPKSHVDALTPKMTALWDGIFGKKWDLNKVMKIEPPWYDYCHYKKCHQRACFLSLSIILGRIQWEGGNMQTRNRAFTKHPTMLAPCSWISSSMVGSKCLLFKPPRYFVITA